MNAHFLSAALLLNHQYLIFFGVLKMELMTSCLLSTGFVFELYSQPGTVCLSVLCPLTGSMP